MGSVAVTHPFHWDAMWHMAGARGICFTGGFSLSLLIIQASVSIQSFNGDSFSQLEKARSFCFAWAAGLWAASPCSPVQGLKSER